MKRTDEQTLAEVFTFITDIPATCHTSDQAKAVLKILFQRELDQYFDLHPIKPRKDEERQ